MRRYLLLALFFVLSVTQIAAQDTKPSLAFSVIEDNAVQVLAFEERAGIQVGSVTVYRIFGDEFDASSDLVMLASKRNIPLFVVWEPAGEADSNCLQQIQDGNYDSYITSFVRDIKAYGKDVFISFAPEMNGDWNCWGQKPEQFLAANTHIHSFFSEVDNVKWVWQINVVYADQTNLEQYNPGSSMVDIVGIDGYNGFDSKWISFTNVFTKTLATVKEIYPELPIFITETGSIPKDAGSDNTKATWIKGMLASLLESQQAINSHLSSVWNNVKSISWFDFNKERDWRIQTDIPEETAANIAVLKEGLKGFSLTDASSVITDLNESQTAIKVVVWGDNRSNSLAYADNGVIQFQQVPADFGKNGAMILSGDGPTDYYQPVSYKNLYTVVYTAKIHSNGSGSCGLYVNYRPKSQSGKVGIWIGELISGTHSFSVPVDEGVIGLKVQFYCKAGATLEPTISDVRLIEFKTQA